MAAPASPLLHILRFEHSASRVNPAVSVSVMCLSRPSLALPVHGLTCCAQQRRGIIGLHTGVASRLPRNRRDARRGGRGHRTVAVL